MPATRGGPARQQPVGHFLEPIVVITGAAELQPWTCFAPGTGPGPEFAAGFAVPSGADGTAESCGPPGRVFVPAEAHRVGQMIEGFKEPLLFDRSGLRRIEPGVKVADNRHAGRAVEGFEDVGGGELLGCRLSAVSRQ